MVSGREVQILGIWYVIEGILSMSVSLAKHQLEGLGSLVSCISHTRPMTVIKNSTCGLCS